MNKKESFKHLIREFHANPLPPVLKRDLEVPDSHNKIITVFGPRRCGKSSYFYSLIQSLLGRNIPKDRILYLNFEDDRILPLKAGELSLLLEAYFELYPDTRRKELFFFLDEIQNIENWEIFTRRIHDKENIRLFLTGSSSKLLSREIATSLRGRTLSFALGPLNFREYLRFRKIKAGEHSEYEDERFKIKRALEDYLDFGGFPEIVLEPNLLIRNKILEEYFESLTYRDLAERHKIENLDVLKDLLKHLMTHFTSLFSNNAYYKSIKQAIPVSRQTLSQYLSLIKETGYFNLLPIYSRSLKEQKVNPQKILCLDNGIRNRIVVKHSTDIGRAAENLVGNMLLGKHESVFYWEDKCEVDFVVVNRGIPKAVNVTYGDEIPKRETESLLKFMAQYPKSKPPLLITKDSEQNDGPVPMIPLWKWLLEQGA